MKKEYVSKLVKLGMLTAVSIILVYMIHFPIFPAAPFLEYDMADVPILIGAYMFGPFWGLGLTAVVSVLQWVLVSPQSGWVGAAMHFFATGSYVLVAGSFYRRYRTLGGAVISMVLGSLTQVIVMAGLNLIVTVRLYGVPLEVVKDMMVPVIIPFNAFKTAVNSLLTLLLYKRVSKLLSFEFSPDTAK